MPAIGLKHIVVGKYGTSGTTVTYTGGRVLARAIKSDIKITNFDEKCYADDGVAENMSGFREGTLALNLADLDQTARMYLLGGTETAAEITGDTDTKELASSGSDTAPDVGVGFYCPQITNGARSYRAIWLTRVKFTAPDESMETRGDSVKFAAPTISGAIMLDAADVWKREVTVDTEAKAAAWLDGKAAVATA